MDSNNSLKRLLRRSRLSNKDQGQYTVGDSSERVDLREGGGDYFLSRTEVDEWDKETLKSCVSEQPTEDQSATPLPRELLPCERDGNWKNMNEALTSKMWGVFDETGIFLIVSTWICATIG